MHWLYKHFFGYPIYQSEKKKCHKFIWNQEILPKILKEKEIERNYWAIFSTILLIRTEVRRFKVVENLFFS